MKDDECGWSKHTFILWHLRLDTIYESHKMLGDALIDIFSGIRLLVVY
jgi:hypothetical protein